MFLIFFSSLFAGQPRPSRRIDALGAGRAGSKHRKPPASIRAEVSGPPEVYKIAQPNIQAGRLHATRWQWEQGCWERHIRRDKPARACCAERGNALGRAKRSAAAEWAHATDASGAVGMPTTANPGKRPLAGRRKERSTITPRSGSAFESEILLATTIAANISASGPAGGRAYTRSGQPGGWRSADMVGAARCSLYATLTGARGCKSSASKEHCQRLHEEAHGQELGCAQNSCRRLGEYRIFNSR